MESQETKITSESMKKCSGDLMCAALLMNLIGSAMEHGLGVINTSGTQDEFSVFLYALQMYGNVGRIKYSCTR